MAYWYNYRGLMEAPPKRLQEWWASCATCLQHACGICCVNTQYFYLLPPTHRVWGKVMFSVCLFTDLVDGSGTIRGMPPTTNNTWWMDLELQGGMPTTANDTWWMDQELQGACPLLLLTPGGWIWNYRGACPPTSDTWSMALELWGQVVCLLWSCRRTFLFQIM